MVNTLYNKKTWLSYSRSALVLFSLIMFVSVNVLYLILLLINLDPNWTVSYAFQWCVGEALVLVLVVKCLVFLLRSVMDHHYQQQLHRPDDDFWVRPRSVCRSDQSSPPPLSISLSILARHHCRSPGVGLSGDLSSGDPEQPLYWLQARSPPGTAPSDQQLGLHDPDPDTQDTGPSGLHS